MTFVTHKLFYITKCTVIMTTKSKHYAVYEKLLSLREQLSNNDDQQQTIRMV